MVDDVIKFTNFSETVAKLKFKETQVDEAVQRAAQFYVTTGVTEIKQRSSGRPGPNVISDTLRSGTQGDIIETRKCYAKVHIWNPTEYAPYVEFMKGGTYSFYRTGIKAAIEKTEKYYREQLEAIME